MDNRIETILEKLKIALGLQTFVLHSQQLTEELSAFGGFDVLLSADLLPPISVPIERDDPLPEGAVSIMYSLRFQQLRYAVTVGGVSKANSLTTEEDKEAYFLQWLELQTDLQKEENFQLKNRTNESVEGVFVLNGIPVSTEGFFEVQWDDEGRLLLAMLPMKVTTTVENGPFSVTLESIEPLVRQQLTRIRLPLEEEERFHDYYAVDEVYISTTGDMFPFFSEEQAAVFPRTILHWKSSESIQFKRQPIQPFPELTVTQAFEVLQHPFQQVTDDHVSQCKMSAIRFLSSQLPEESGQWELHRVQRQPNILEVVCQKTGEISGPLRRKIVFMMEPHTYEILNYMDSNEMAHLFEGFTQPLLAVVTQDEAFDEMLPYITLEPTYVYDQKKNIYKLCGLLDANECVDAITRELKQLNDL